MRSKGPGRSPDGYDSPDPDDLLDDEVEPDDEEEGRGAAPRVEALLGELLPEGFDWADLVRAYPIPALLLAAVGGYYLGRTRGEAIVEALSEFAAGQVSRQVNELLGEEIL